MKRHNLYFECKSYEQLMAGEVDARDLNEYAMVVIDEAHAFRNPETQRAQQLRQVLQGSPPKNLVLLTATPVNNSLWDLYYLLTYFMQNDAAFADLGIRSLRAHFAEAMATDPDDLSPERLFDVLDDLGAAHPTLRQEVLPARSDHDRRQEECRSPSRAPVRITVTYDLEGRAPAFSRVRYAMVHRVAPHRH